MLLGTSLFLINPVLVAAEQDGDFIYQVDGAPRYAIITGYTGSGGDIVIPATLGGYVVKAIGDEAFQSFTTITSVELPQTLQSIGQGSFAYCSALTSITIPNSVMRLGANAFQYCISLTSVSLGYLIPSIEPNTFYYCTKLSTINLPDSITSVGGNAFSHCTSLKSVTLGKGVTAIGTNAFDSCTGLTSVNIGGSVKSIGDGAFAHCTSLAAITIPDSVVSIGANCFSYSISLNSMIFGRTIASIGQGALAHCTSLTSVTYLGVVAPKAVGDQWIVGTNMGLRGHAPTASDFPEPGNSFYGMTMGIALPSEPGPPRAVLGIAGDGCIALNWTAPVSDGGKNITEYRVYRSLSENGSYGLVGTTAGLTMLDTGLQNGITYYYTVAAVNSIGKGPECAPIHATSGTPTAPRSFTANSGEGKVTLSWQAPIDDSGNPVTGYKIFRTHNGEVLQLATVAAYNLDYVDTTGDIGVQYGYSVQAVNGNGDGAVTLVVNIASHTTSANNMSFLLIMIGIIAVAAIVVFFYYQRKKKQRKDREAAVTNQFDPSIMYEALKGKEKK
jgi:hypothetical protein